MNPFKEKAKKPEDYLSSIEKLYPKQYDKNETSPYTKTRIIRVRRGLRSQLALSSDVAPHG